MKQSRRVQVPMSEEVRAQLQGAADAKGTSLAMLCSQILTETAPVMAEIAIALRKVNRAPAAAMRDVMGLLDEATANADQIRLDLSPKATGVKKKKAS